MVITLNPNELIVAATVGVRRRIAMLDGSRVNNITRTRDWNQDIESACAEMAVGKALNQYVPMGVSDPSVCDVGLHIQVRWTPYASGHLIVRANDPDEDLFVLVTGKAPTYKVVGCMRGLDCKQSIWVGTVEGKPYFQVPQSALECIDAYKR